MKPIIKYRGGKSKEITNFIQFVPNDFVRYVEPFAGGAALYFYLGPYLVQTNDIIFLLFASKTSIRVVGNYNEFNE